MIEKKTTKQRYFFGLEIDDAVLGILWGMSICFNLFVYCGLYMGWGI